MTAIVLGQLERRSLECLANVTTTERKRVSSVVNTFRLIYIVSKKRMIHQADRVTPTRFSVDVEGLVDLSDPLRYPASRRVCTLMRAWPDRKRVRREVRTRILTLA
jgi:hypothetical protein